MDYAGSAARISYLEFAIPNRLRTILLPMRKTTSCTIRDLGKVVGREKPNNPRQFRTPHAHMPAGTLAWRPVPSTKQADLPLEPCPPRYRTRPRPQTKRPSGALLQPCRKPQLFPFHPCSAAPRKQHNQCRDESAPLRRLPPPGLSRTHHQHHPVRALDMRAIQPQRRLPRLGAR